MGEAVEIGGLVQVDPKLKNYRLRVERFIREHETHPTIQRIKNNQPLHPGDIDSLEAILFSDDGPGTREEFVETYGSEEPLAHWCAASSASIAMRPRKHLPSSSPKTNTAPTNPLHQPDHRPLGSNGLMDPKRLFEPPFTDLHHQGVSGVMGDSAAAIIKAVRQINENAGVQV